MTNGFINDYFNLYLKQFFLLFHFLLMLKEKIKDYSYMINLIERTIKSSN